MARDVARNFLGGGGKRGDLGDCGVQRQSRNLGTKPPEAGDTC